MEPVEPVEPAEPVECVDEIGYSCEYFKDEGDCDEKASFFNGMKEKCPLTCGFCKNFPEYLKMKCVSVYEINSQHRPACGTCGASGTCGAGGAGGLC